MPAAAPAPLPEIDDLDSVDFSKLDFGNDVVAEELDAPPPVAEVAPVVPPEPAPAAAEAQPDSAQPEGEASGAPVGQEPAAPETDAAANEAATTRIPKHRFDYVQTKRREAEERAAALEAELAKFRAQQEQEQKPQGPTYESVLSDLDLQIEQARLDGDAEKAAKLRGEQRKVEAQWLAQQTQATSHQTVTQAQEAQVLNELITQLEEAYPQFVEGSEVYDKDLVEEVLELHAAYVAKGKRPSEAMAKASSYVLRANGLLKDDADIEAPEAQEAPKPAAPKKTDVAKNTKAAAAQPPPLEKAGLDSSKAGVTKSVDIMHMSIEEFEKLGEKDLAKARGDFEL